jgi:acyl-CoA synthetase (AMP-forming)/AMP-acid ligase II
MARRAAGQPIPGAEELRAYCRQNLPDALIPSVWIVLQDIPLNPNGKVDRKALPVPSDGA